MQGFFNLGWIQKTIQSKTVIIYIRFEILSTVASYQGSKKLKFNNNNNVIKYNYCFITVDVSITANQNS